MNNKIGLVDDTVKDFKSEFEKRMYANDLKFERVLISIEKNTEALEKLTEETKDVVELVRDLKGAIRLGRNTQKFMLWLSKWGIVGAAIISLLNWGDHIIEKILNR